MLRVIDNVARTCSLVPLTDKSNEIIRKVLYVKKRIKLMVTKICGKAQNIYFRYNLDNWHFLSFSFIYLC